MKKINTRESLWRIYGISIEKVIDRSKIMLTWSEQVPEWSKGDGVTVFALQSHITSLEHALPAHETGKSPKNIAIYN